jgi:hypothetical protein
LDFFLLAWAVYLDENNAPVKSDRRCEGKSVTSTLAIFFPSDSHVTVNDEPRPSKMRAT